MIVAVLIVAVLTVAFANGANDNFKGVATLFGSGTTNYRLALAWATITTLLGSVAAFFLASALIGAFKGKGLVSDALISDPSYLAAVAVGAAGTVLLATRLGMPVSTTHALVGSLVGAALAAGSPINGGTLASNFFGPLLASPLLAILLTVGLHTVCRALRLRAGVTEETCFCVGQESQPVAIVPAISGEMALVKARKMTASLGSEVTCRRRYAGDVLGIRADSLLDALHYLSSGIVSFARGLNDTPKIAALLIAGTSLSPFLGTAGIGVAMMVGGLLAARRVAETMSLKITPMNPGQGFAANLVTGFIVIVASRFGFPVSTTHVSCGGLFGVGAVTSEARWDIILQILLAWLVTLPLAAAIAAAALVVLSPATW